MDNLDSSIKKLRTRDPKVTFTLNQKQSAISLLRGNLEAPVNVTELRKTPYEHARRFIRENKPMFGEIEEVNELIDENTITSLRGTTHVGFQQKYGDALVLGGTLSVHYGADGGMYLIKSNLAFAIDVPKEPEIPVGHAVEIAKQHAGEGSLLYENMEPLLLVVDAKTLHLDDKSQRYYLCWKMRIIPPKSSRTPDQIYLIDAIKGEVLIRYSALQTLGTGYYSIGTALNSEATGGTFRLRDTVTSAPWLVATQPVIHTYDDANSGSLNLRNYSEDTNNNWNNGGVVPANRFDDQRAEVDVHRYLGYVLSYYFLIHGHNSWDHAGADIRCHAHSGIDWGNTMPNNAFWDPDGHEIYFGDGEGKTRDFYTTLDVAGHEFTHGVNTGFNILQTYFGEIGAANEAIADLFGCLITLNHPAEDPWPWHHGRQCRLDGTVGRNMIDPSRDGNGVVQYDATNEDTKYKSMLKGFYPDHYSIRYNPPIPLNEDNDYGGVHVNAPIITHAVYLMMNGGTHRLSNVTVQGIGVAPVEQMLYHVISTKLLNNISNFLDLYQVFIEVCKDLYPNNLNYLATVKTAFHAVGIGPDAGPFAYITNHFDNYVSVIDTVTDFVSARVPQIINPWGVAVSPNGKYVYVTQCGSISGITIIDAVTNNIIDVNIPYSESEPRGIAINQTGTKVYVANYGSDAVSVIDTVTWSVATVNTMKPYGIVVSPDEKKVFVAGYGSVLILDTATNTFDEGCFNVGADPRGIAINREGTKLYVANYDNDTVSAIDLVTWNVTSVPVGHCPWGVAISPDGLKVYVANHWGAEVSLIDTTNNTITATIKLTIGTEVPYTEDYIAGLAITPDGKKLYVAMMYENGTSGQTVSVIDTVTNQVIKNVTVGIEPVAFGQFIVPPS